MLKKTRKNQGVSEVVGTILLLVIAVTLFSTVYTAFFSIQPGPSTPAVTIVGTIENNFLVLEHRGGESLGLNTGVIIEFQDGLRKMISVNDQDFLNSTYKADGNWNMGEKFVYSLNNNINFSRFEPINITIVDKKSNSIVMRGNVQEPKVADVKVTMDVSDYQPLINSVINIIITASNIEGPSDASNVLINYFLPSSFTYISHTKSQGNYDTETGVWDVGNINVGSNATLKIKAKISVFDYNQIKQFVILLDGSGSIASKSWKLACDGLANAIYNESVFPRDGSVELTIIQFGVNNVCARVEIGPVVIYENNINSIKDQIIALKNKQGKGWTPIAAAFYLGNDILANSINFGGFNPNYKQIFVLVTDGNANVKSNPGDYCGTNAGNELIGKTSAAQARNYLLNSLTMTDDRDEIDVIAVDPGYGHAPIDEEFLCDNIVWPQPCFDGVPPPENDLGWPPAGTGWYRHVDGWQEFYDTISSIFKVIFNKITIHAELKDIEILDKNSNNNVATVTLYPRNQ